MGFRTIKRELWQLDQMWEETFATQDGPDAGPAGDENPAPMPRPPLPQGRSGRSAGFT